ncbi:peptidyl-prolyl cis-trans isomerase [Sulfurimonas sp. SAG-AH-194-C20]|nr:peptidylprolyl isomerase [Sulfurimonas sp. SAG-AH-194-C20]MDF1879655.1 peptidyl-prolyl cis-trans isomerase [Sulfurimonas sp. SAG-AH-194-C20]
MMQKLLREPLVSFLLLGLVLYLYYTDVKKNDEIVNTKLEINVSSHEVQKLQNEYTKKYQRKMSPEELILYIHNVYRKKVLLEESTVLGLHKSDALISQQLIEKMEFILLGSVEYEEPSEKELQKYYAKNIDDYSALKNLSFSHIYFSSNYNNMDELYKMLSMSQFDESQIENLGDSFVGTKSYDGITYEETYKKFGKYFASKLFRLKKGLWHKALHSKYGVHLIYIKEKITENPYEFDEVEDRVYEDYLRQKRDETVMKAYDDILDNYTLRLDNPTL